MVNSLSNKYDSFICSGQYKQISGRTRSGRNPGKCGETSAISDEVVAQKMLIHGRCD